MRMAPVIGRSQRSLRVVAMCHYIYATLSGEASIEQARSIARKHGRDLLLQDNGYMRAQLAAGERYLLASNGSHCDCSTPLGTLAVDTDAVDPARLERKLRRLRRQGWSEAKIARWMQEQENTRDKERREREGLREAQRGSVDRWIELVRELLETGTSHSFGLLLHWGHEFRVDIEDEQHFTLSQLGEELLLAMEEDVLYRFVRG